MIRAVVIDRDETSVQFLREQITNIHIVKVFTSNAFSLQTLEKLRPEIIFMNIDEPTCIHIDLIQYISNHQLLAHLIFIKEDEQTLEQTYVHETPVKYVVKPYTKKQLEKLMKEINDDIIYPNYPVTEVCLFKYFHIKKAGNNILNIKWRTAKARELLIYLIQHYGEIVRKDVLVELLWPDASVDKAYDNLYASIYYIRKLLSELHIGIHIHTHVNGYEIEFHNVTCDVIEFNQLFEEIMSDIRQEVDKQVLIHKFNRLKQLYSGEYLEEESYVWKEHLKEKCRVQFLSIARKINQLFIEQEDVTNAILLSLDIQKLYPYMDYSYFTLMKLYSEYGDMENVERQYMKLKTMLYDEFNTEPNEAIKMWYQNWIKMQYA